MHNHSVNVGDTIQVRSSPGTSTKLGYNLNNITLIQVGEGPPASAPIAFSYMRKLPFRGSSNTPSQELNDRPKTNEPLKSRAPAEAATERQSSMFWHKAAAAQQTVAVPKRTTSLKEPPKQIRRSDASLHNHGGRLFSSIDNMLASAQDSAQQKEVCYSTQPRKHTSISLHNTATHDTRRTVPAPEYLASTYSSTERLVADHRYRGRLPLNTAIVWTSDDSRLLEYEKIDRAHSGVRGFCKDLLPKSWCSNGRRNFFKGNCDGDSVRRYRLSISNKLGAGILRNRRWDCLS